jgi:hypothetical protein
VGGWVGGWWVGGWVGDVLRVMWESKKTISRRTL